MRRILLGIGDCLRCTRDISFMTQKGKRCEKKKGRQKWMSEEKKLHPQKATSSRSEDSRETDREKGMKIGSARRQFVQRILDV